MKFTQINTEISNFEIQLKSPKQFGKQKIFNLFKQLYLHLLQKKWELGFTLIPLLQTSFKISSTGFLNTFYPDFDLHPGIFLLYYLFILFENQNRHIRLKKKTHYSYLIVNFYHKKSDRVCNYEPCYSRSTNRLNDFTFGHRCYRLHLRFALVSSLTVGVFCLSISVLSEPHNFIITL